MGLLDWPNEYQMSENPAAVLPGPMSIARPDLGDQLLIPQGPSPLLRDGGPGPARAPGAIDPGSRIMAGAEPSPDVSGAPALSASPYAGMRDKLSDIFSSAAGLQRKVAGAGAGVVAAQRRARDAEVESQRAGDLYRQWSGQATDKSLETQRVLQEGLAEQTAKAAEPVKTKEKAFAKAITDFQSAGAVDPSRVWRDEKGNKNTAMILGAALMSGIGAFASAVGGGPNYALEIINTAIARDIEAQRDEIGKKRSNVDLSGLELSASRQIFDDERSQLMGAFNLKLDRVRQGLAARLEEMKSPSYKAAGKKLLAEIDAQIAQSSASLLSQTAAAEQDRNLKAFGMDVDLAQAEARDREAQAKALAASAGMQVPGVDFFGTPSEKDVEKVKEISAKFYATKRALTEAISMLQKNNIWTDAPGGNRAEQLRQGVLAALESQGYSSKQAEAMVPEEFDTLFASGGNVEAVKNILGDLTEKAVTEAYAHKALLTGEQATPGQAQGSIQAQKNRGQKLGP